MADFEVKTADGSRMRLEKMPLEGLGILKRKEDEDKTERLVRVEWDKVLDLDDAIWGKGFFGNQNSLCKPRAKKWRHTVERLKQRFSVQ